MAKQILEIQICTVVFEVHSAIPLVPKAILSAFMVCGLYGVQLWSRVGCL